MSSNNATNEPELGKWGISRDELSGKWHVRPTIIVDSHEQAISLVNFIQRQLAADQLVRAAELTFEAYGFRSAP